MSQHTVHTAKPATHLLSVHYTTSNNCFLTSNQIQHSCSIPGTLFYLAEVIVCGRHCLGVA